MKYTNVINIILLTFSWELQIWVSISINFFCIKTKNKLEIGLRIYLYKNVGWVLNEALTIKFKHSLAHMGRLGDEVFVYKFHARLDGWSPKDWSVVDQFKKHELLYLSCMEDWKKNRCHLGESSLVPLDPVNIIYYS